MELSSCIKEALAGNKGLKASGMMVDAARAQVGMARSGYLPRLEISETYMYTDNPVMGFMSKLNQRRFGASDFMISNLNEPDPISNFNFRAQIMQPVFNGGRVYYGMERARSGVNAAGKAHERSEQEVIAAVVEAYWGVALADEYLAVADMARETTGKHLELAESMFRNEMLVESEVLMAKVRLAEVEEMRFRALNSLKTAKAALNLAMGRDLGATLDISGALRKTGFDRTLDDMLVAARDSRPDLAAMSYNVDGLEAAKKAEMAGYLPSVNFVGRYDMDQEKFLSGGGESYTLMGVATWNIFDGLYTTNSVDEARARQLSAQHAYESMSDGVEFEVRRAYYSVEEAGLRIDAAGTAVDEGTESLRIIRKRFEAGLARTIDVLDAETALTRARTNRAQALYDYNVSIAKLMLAVGILTPSFYGDEDVR